MKILKLFMFIYSCNTFAIENYQISNIITDSYIDMAFPTIAPIRTASSTLINLVLNAFEPKEDSEIANEILEKINFGQ